MALWYALRISLKCPSFSSKIPPVRSRACTQSVLVPLNTSQARATGTTQDLGLCLAKRSALDLRNGLFVGPLGQVCAFPLANMAYAHNGQSPPYAGVWVSGTQSCPLKAAAEAELRGTSVFRQRTVINFNKLSTWLRLHVLGN